MKKHILGVALFSLIVASFAIVYAFFYTPSIPLKETVKPPVLQTESQAEKTYACQFRRSQLSYEVLSSQFDLDTNKFTSKIKLSWNGEADAPERAYIKLELFSVAKARTPIYIITQTMDNPFPTGNQTITTIESEVPASIKINQKENLYAFFDFSQNYLGNSETRTQRASYPVLIVHGKDAAVKNTIPVKE